MFEPQLNPFKHVQLPKLNRVIATSPSRQGILGLII